ncbi:MULTISPECIES: DEAD/DEAH box helicase [Shewanella]|uniref:DEAD/DEAH box helicase family protein n=1 Tax=Shewanella metallivivens TaxID=2872342 RepID=A0ABT5TSJ1_9GAMM|nr:DEAD/DEAH box helicase family protein [Shewanella metallivivens]MDD8060376.1 DEAD/DEAH box helicase family protein [Shewanella metallivivens]
MRLRRWQNACIDSSLKQYLNGQSHFLVLATPGSGKTLMASVLSNHLLKNDLVDLIFCFSPSSIVSMDFAECLQLRSNERFDGLIGSKGRAYTYQHLQYLDGAFWELFEKYRVFVIFDEIHHCAGSTVDNANSWGEHIILNIQNKARFTMALTGTPWRSDTAPIVFASYASPDGEISCDYVYGLHEAILDGVCRVPQIIAIDNNHISVIESNETVVFESFDDLLSNSQVAYQDVIENEDVIKHIITSASKKLDFIRLENSNAAGLIVASSIEQANRISTFVKKWLEEEAVVATYKENDPTAIIQRFRHSESKWIISVGMISEGTNIPRLQVCCYLSNIKTEMYFRQTLGRILRVTDTTNQEAILYMPAEPKLLEYAYRVRHDVPVEADVVKFETMQSLLVGDETISQNKTISLKGPSIDLSGNEIKLNDFNENIDSLFDEDFLSTSYDQVMNIFGRFKQETIGLGLGLGELK